MATPHISANKGDIAESILLPGDPMRAKYIADTFLTDVVCFNEVRGMLGFTGMYKGKRISAMGTGMGIPSISIYATELMTQYGCKNLIRVGTCGSLRPEIDLNDIILAQGACTDSAVMERLFPGTYAPIADFELLKAAYELAIERGIKPHVGLVKSGDTFYNDYTLEGADRWVLHGVLGLEMEAAALYMLAARYSAKALAICTVSDSVLHKNELSSDDRERSLNNMITIALDVAASLA